jgi:hypothetical protein
MLVLNLYGRWSGQFAGKNRASARIFAHNVTSKNVKFRGEFEIKVFYARGTMIKKVFKMFMNSAI